VRIDRVELYELVLPLVEPFIISGGAITERRSLIVVLADGEGHFGYGESPPFELPFYSEETLAGARHVLEHILLPRLAAREFELPEDVDAALRTGIRGNPFARAGAETAVWDLAAHRRGTGVAALVAERVGEVARTSVDCGVALGIPSDRNPDTLSRQVEAVLPHGYRRVKIKVAPGWCGEALQAARRGMKGTDLPLTVDANGAYRWPDDERDLRTLDEAGLLYIEQPLAPEEILGHASLGRVLKTPICLDETLRSASVAQQVVDSEGPMIWNLKVHRVGGLTESCAIYRLAQRHGARLWAGTMPESGIGSQAPLAMAALPAFVYPSDLEPSARWYGRGTDVVKLVMGRDGRMAVPAQPIARLLDSGRFRSATRRLV
jgi:O-succinylbenzoate synthase